MSQLKLLPEPLKDNIRTFFLQSFQLQCLQSEYQELTESLKLSLIQRMKFEICEMKVNESNFFFYLRMFHIKNYLEKV